MTAPQTAPVAAGRRDRHGLPFPFSLDHNDRVARKPATIEYAARGAAGHADALEYANRRARRTGVRQSVVLGRGGVVRNRWVVQAIR